MAQESVFEVPAPPVGVESGGAFVVDGDRAFFCAKTEVGRELYVTDGTPAGTRLVIDLVTGPIGGASRVLAMLGGRLLFEAVFGYWLTDGTVAGTSRFDLGGAQIGTVAGTVGNRLVLTLGDPTSGFSIVSIDAAGNIEPLAQADLGATVSLGGRLYLETSLGLLETDGTTEGTRLIRSGVAGLAVARGLVWYFRPEFWTCELFAFDPQAGERPPVLLPVPGFAVDTRLAPTPGGVVFRVAAGQRRLMVSDGTLAGTRFLEVPLDDVGPPLPWNDRALCYANDLVHGYEPWITDGTDEGTLLLADLAPGHSGATLFAATAQGTFFRTLSPTGTRLMFTDGTPAGTQAVADHALDLAELTAFGDRALYRESASFPQPQGNVFAAEAGDAGTTALLGSQAQLPVLPRLSSETVGGQLAFFVGDGAWVSDGRLAGTSRIGTTAGAPRARGQELAAVAGDSLLVPEDVGSGFELRSWDSASKTTSTVPLPGPRTTLSAITHRDDLAYLADGQLLITDGSNLGTAVIGMPTGWPDDLWATPGRVFALTSGILQAFDAAAGQWQDVDVETLRIVASIGERVIVERVDGLLYATEGGPPESLGVVAGDLSVLTWRGQTWLVSGALWSTDGTLAGTRLFPPPTGVRSAAALDDGIYFVGYTDAHGSELWKFDGATYARVTDLVPGPRSGVFAVATCGNRLFLAASDGSDGIEPYASDGTQAGTHRLADLMPGLASSQPVFLRVAGEHAFFTAHRPGFHSVFAVPLAQLGVAHSERIGQGCAGQNGIPQLAVSEPPRVGAVSFRFELQRARPFAPVLFALGTDTVLQPLGGCRLRVGGGVVTMFGVSSGAGTARWNQPIPAIPALAGLPLTAQAAVFDGSGAGPGFALSTALRLVLGAP